MFDQEDALWMKLLVSHVSRGLGLMQRLDTARLQNSSLMLRSTALSSVWPFA